METEFRDGIGRLVAPYESFPAGDGFSGGVEVRGDVVAHDLVAHRGGGGRAESREKGDRRNEALHNVMTAHDGTVMGERQSVRGFAAGLRLIYRRFYGWRCAIDICRR